MNRTFIPEGQLVGRSLAIYALAILALPALGAHLHLCFDGGEPPASLHATYDDVGHSAGAAPSHHDVDVELANTALGKKFTESSDGPAVPAAALIVLPPPSIEAFVVPQRTDSFVPVAALQLRPPPRGPPV